MGAGPPKIAPPEPPKMPNSLRLATYFRDQFRAQCQGKGLMVVNIDALAGNFARLRREGVDLNVIPGAIDSFCSGVRVGRIKLKGAPWRTFLGMLDSLVQAEAVKVKVDIPADPNRNAAALAAMEAEQ